MPEFLSQVKVESKMEMVVWLTASMWLQMVKTFLDLVSQHQNTPQLNQPPQ